MVRANPVNASNISGSGRPGGCRGDKKTTGKRILSDGPIRAELPGMRASCRPVRPKDLAPIAAV
jgi:hypothetical protein